MYVIGGLGSSFASLFYYYYNEPNVVSAGASGCLFGILGALIVSAMIKPENKQGIKAGQFAFIAALALASGFFGDHVDNSAHIGGFLCGMLTAFIIETISKKLSVR